MAVTAQALIKGHANSAKLIKEVRVLEADKLQELGMNLFWNVGKGAESQPRCLVVHYKGDESTDEVHYGFVGKGVTYDTGGLNIKPTGGMESMYGDKGGSTAVIGALMGCLDLSVKANIIFSCGFAENAVGKGAYKPSDILTAMNGLTVEVGNTDAEGRLVLGDTMTYIQRNFKPKFVCYIATLTGASVVALGKTTAGVFSTNKATVKDLKSAAELADESLWHLPLLDEHREAIKGHFGADITNKALYPFGGASQAAAFLENFIEDKREWAHLDIAGPGIFAESDMSGFGAKILLAYIVQKSA
jgi:leucyl aminopeptidase